LLVFALSWVKITYRKERGDEEAYCRLNYESGHPLLLGSYRFLPHRSWIFPIRGRVFHFTMGFVDDTLGIGDALTNSQKGGNLAFSCIDFQKTLNERRKGDEKGNDCNVVDFCFICGAGFCG
jgi:hypothetical protein